MPAQPLNPGRVEWSGGNPGMFLKEREDGPWTTLALFFRIVTSVHGRGHAMVVLEEPGQAKKVSEACNVCIADNMALARFLINDFVAKFGPFRDSAGFKALAYEPLADVGFEGDARTRYVERVKSPTFDIALVWEELGRPTAMKMPVENSGTHEHEMYSVLVESRRAQVVVNGRTLKGRPVAREQAGLKTTTAFLYFSETWVRPPGG
ncbi:MAG: hypothetical protein ACT4P2_05265 [Pseudomonadota bacterium]